MMKKGLICAALSCMIFAGCTSSQGTSTSSNSGNTETAPAAQTTAATTVDESQLEWKEALNFTPPQKGEKIIVMDVKDYGTIKIKLFPAEVPQACENFMGLTEMNYYDELIFHRIIPGFMNQGGDPQGTGYGGQSLWGDKFESGLSHKLYHFSGAVCYANSGSTSTSGSQFYIVNTPSDFIYTQIPIEEYPYPQSVKDKYKEVGGTPFLDGGYTVFGQVFEGMDVVRAMAEVETDENDKPLKMVQMKTVRIEEYDGE